MKLRILIVDDDLDFAESLADIIQLKGHGYYIANSGMDAIVQYSRKPFDLVLMDMKMPGLNGVQAFNGIRKIYSDARVTMMTGFAMETQLTQALQNGALSILAKPIDINKLVGILDQANREQIILLVDDDEDFSSGLKDLLERHGLRTIIASNGKEAIDFALNSSFDVLLLDLRLPDSHGLEVVNRLKKEGRVIPTIVITAYAEEESEAIKQFSEDWEGEVLSKPINPSLLLDRIGDLRTTNNKQV